jgi:hypothetical protein
MTTSHITHAAQPLHTHRLRMAAIVAVACAMAALSACGGLRDDDPPVATIPVTSIEAFTGYVASQPANDEVASPIDLEGVVPPTSETAEPAVVG